jgi:predicted transposase/invertase (TIGR01784 family)
MLAERVNKWIAQYKAEGREEGRIQGKQDGRREGKLEGKVEGKLEGMATILKRMKEKGMSVTEIATITGLPEDEIQHLI